jgi:homotetrameric NADPH-dependent glutamate synthase
LKVNERVLVNERTAEERVRDFDEVTLGYDPDSAIAEASRCLMCEKPPCVDGCPIRIDIPRFIAQVKEGEIEEAFETLKRVNYLPGITGRVCPQEEQCEVRCTLGKVGDPVNIGKLERFVADYVRDAGSERPPVIRDKRMEKIALIGSGPSGMTCGATLASKGYQVTIFEGLHEAGGVLKYGIPEFRLPKDVVDYEIGRLTDMGVIIRKNCVIGKNITYDELRDAFDAIYIATGAGAPNFLDIEGESLNGIYSANEFLTRINLMRAYDPDYDTPVSDLNRVAVIGGGNVALDSARCAKRLGAMVDVIYRRTEEESPARNEEIQHAKEEGINFNFLRCPKRFIGENGWLKGIELMKMTLGEPDESGRKKPETVKDSEYIANYDTAIIACGQNPNRLFYKSAPELDVTSWGGIVVDNKLMTSIKGTFAGGDAMSGAATVIEAMRDGLKAAESIHRFLKKRKRRCYKSAINSIH